MQSKFAVDKNEDDYTYITHLSGVLPSQLLSIGCATALPMGVAPEAIAKFFSGIGSKAIDISIPYTVSFDFYRHILLF
jgi:hypothetical protein